MPRAATRGGGGRAGATTAASSAECCSAATYPLQPKHRWSIKNHFLTGITLPAWLRLLRRHGACIDWALFWQRALFLTVMGAVNSVLGLVDSLLYGRQIREQELHPEPLIILGHPRTGTTHIHNLLALDPRFAYARTLHAGFPAAFLWIERFKWALRGFIDRTRPMDAMPLTLDTPAEDEIAVSALTGTASAYLPLVFMRDRRMFDRFYTFRGAAERDFAAWRDALLWFLKKVTLRWSRSGNGSCSGASGGQGPAPPKPLLIKSPVHTARVALLLRLFPRARFVYVHRDPLTTFASAAHMANTYYWYCYLQQPSETDVTDFILDQFDLLHQTYLEDRKLIPPGRLVEVAFAELDADPLGTLRRIYSGLSLPGFESVRPAFRRYCEGLELSGFKKNAHRPLSPELQRRVRKRWAQFYRDFGYPLGDAEHAEHDVADQE